MRILIATLSLGVVLANSCLLQAQSVCKADASHIVRICFPEGQPAYKFNRCTKQLLLNFYIDVYGAQYRYAVKVVRGKDIEAGQVVFQSPDSAKWYKAEPLGLPPASLQPISLLQQEGINSEYDISGIYTVRVLAASLGSDGKDDGPPIIEDKEITIVHKRHVRSIVIGVSLYKYGSASPTADKPIENLHFAAHDAESFSKLLTLFFKDKEDDYREVPLSDSTATKQAIDDAIADVQDPDDGVCDPNDVLIFYFSGHTFQDSTGDARYVGTWDIDPKHLYRGLTYDLLLTGLAAVHARKLVFLDSCFSGYQLDPHSTTQSHSTRDKGKLQAFLGGQVVNDIALPAEQQSKVIQFITQLAPNYGFFAAASVNRQAQEGVVLKTIPPGKDKHFFFPDEVIPSADSVGHGFFTYLLLKRVEQLFPPAFPVPDLADDGQTASLGQPGQTSPGCSVDLNTAEKEAELDVPNFAKDGRSVQKPWALSDLTDNAFRCQSAP